MIVRTIIELQLDVRDDFNDDMKEGIVNDIMSVMPLQFKLHGVEETDVDDTAIVGNSCISFLPKDSKINVKDFNPLASLKVTQEKIQEEDDPTLKAALSGNVNDMI